MPTLCTFYGIAIRMYWRDHGPPHFHAIYAEHKAAISIRDLTIISGGLPARAAELTLEWARLHRTELLEDWHLCQRNLEPKPIDPLD
jgi:hypothetical protein